MGFSQLRVLGAYEDILYISTIEVLAFLLLRILAPLMIHIPSIKALSQAETNIWGPKTLKHEESPFQSVPRD